MFTIYSIYSSRNIIIYAYIYNYIIKITFLAGTTVTAITSRLLADSNYIVHMINVIISLFFLILY